ncbi:MAG: hypothetical protein D3924_00465 [Candidatus Electrothrix sp. AR4]|nr:hypothetical protein [Candidatus Electrothrix sp. AR4]
MLCSLLDLQQEPVSGLLRQSGSVFLNFFDHLANSKKKHTLFDFFFLSAIVSSLFVVCIFSL